MEKLALRISARSVSNQCGPSDSYNSALMAKSPNLLPLETEHTSLQGIGSRIRTSWQWILLLVGDLWRFIQNISRPDPLFQGDRDRIKCSEQGWERPASCHSELAAKIVGWASWLSECSQEKKMLPISGFLFQRTSRLPLKRLTQHIHLFLSQYRYMKTYIDLLDHSNALLI